MRKVNYLNNKDILKEIHKSKKSFCSYLNKVTDSDFDIIIPNLDVITPELIVEAREARAIRLAKLEQDKHALDGKKVKLAEVLTPIEDIDIEDIVFRVTTWDHVPIDDDKQAKSDAKAVALYEEENDDYTDEDLEDITGDTKYLKLNFPPFFHYRLVPADNGADTLPSDPAWSPVIVAKSHWKGQVEGGEFCKTHGQITDKLAHMFIKLCERYATRSNWRGYTYNDEMRGQALLQLAMIGLQFDESKSQNPFAYYTATITNSFTRVLNIEKKNQNIRDDILEMNDLTPSFTRQLMHEGEKFKALQESGGDKPVTTSKK